MLKGCSGTVVARTRWPAVVTGAATPTPCAIDPEVVRNRLGSATLCLHRRDALPPVVGHGFPASTTLPSGHATPPRRAVARQGHCEERTGRIPPEPRNVGTPPPPGGCLAPLRDPRQAGILRFGAQGVQVPARRRQQTLELGGGEPVASRCNGEEVNAVDGHDLDGTPR